VAPHPGGHRARARLNLGDGPGTVADASLVDANFVRVVERAESPSRLQNTLYNNGNLALAAGVTEPYHNLTVGGVPDPRVKANHVGVIGSDNITDMWLQQKYTARGSGIPFSSWREAQLMIAEVQGGQQAVQIINALRATHNLPQFASADPNEIRDQVREERRRELWLQGTRLGDMLRWGTPFPGGANPRGEPYNPRDFTCIPLPHFEAQFNPNL